MDREQVISKLREHASELQASGLLHLHLFGSLARNEATSNSDVDLLADFDSAIHLSLLKISSLQNRLSDILGESVDLSSTPWLKDKIRDRVLQEPIDVF